MNVLDLFSGIGGFSLGLERAGMRTVAFCEIDPYCREVLRKHWPRIPCYDDVKRLQFFYPTREWITAEYTTWRSTRNEYLPGIDIICGGFPCQDISVAGKGAGIEGARSGLWSEFARIIGEVRPRYVIVENVAALLGRGIERVLGDLAALGFDAEWHCIPACAVGAPHQRDRVWIVAYAQQWGEFDGSWSSWGPTKQRQTKRSELGCGGQDVADAAGARFQEWQRLFARGQITDAAASASVWWQSEPDVGRVAHGVPFRVDRLRALGNGIVPQIAEIIGKAIMAHGT